MGKKVGGRKEEIKWKRGRKWIGKNKGRKAKKKRNLIRQVRKKGKRKREGRKQQRGKLKEEKWKKKKGGIKERGKQK